VWFEGKTEVEELPDTFPDRFRIHPVLEQDLLHLLDEGTLTKRREPLEGVEPSTPNTSLERRSLATIDRIAIIGYLGWSYRTTGDATQWWGDNFFTLSFIRIILNTSGYETLVYLVSVGRKDTFHEFDVALKDPP